MSEGVQTQLMEEVTRQLGVLENAITRINDTRTQLKQRSLEVKCDIQSTVTRQLETLREREISLLRQVDLIHQAKDAALTGQESKLYEALGSLTTALQLADRGELDVKLLLDRLKTLNMNPSEGATISFKADVKHVSDTLSNFGKINSHALHFDGLFDKHAGSTSLPKPFEDYDDDEHHVLYKTLENSSNSGKREVSVMIPRLSHRPEDWLFMPTENIAAAKLPNPAQSLFPPFMSSNIKQIIEKPDGLSSSMSSAASIQQWLYDITGQGEGDEEDVDFEVISPPASFIPDSTKGSSIEVLELEDDHTGSFPGFVSSGYQAFNFKAAEMTAASSHSSQNYFDEIMKAPSSSWLLGTGASLPKTSESYCREILSYFNNISCDTKLWLHQYQQTQLENCGTCQTQSTAVDIENLGVLPCANTNQRWLCKTGDEDKDTDDTAINTLCKANEPCLSFSECLSDENCCREVAEISPQAASMEKAKIDDFSVYFSSVLGQGSDYWLISQDKDEFTTVSSDGEDSESIVEYEDSATVMDNFPPFNQSGINLSKWLIGAHMDEARVPPCHLDYSTPVPTADNIWIANSPVPGPNYKEIQDKWQAIFTHQSPHVDSNITSEPAFVDQNVSKIFQRSNDYWLLKPESLTKQTSNKWYPKKNCETKPDVSAKEAWFCSVLNSPGYSQFSKESSPMKSAELPECSDAGSEKDWKTGALFDCFHRKDNMSVWLYKPTSLID